MNIAYVTTFDPHDPSIWAGTSFHIARALEAEGCSLDYIGPLQESARLRLKIQSIITSKLTGKALHRDREPVVLNGYAKQIEARLASSKADVVFSPGTVAITKLQTKLPIVTWTDATYGSIVDFYRWEMSPTDRSRRLGHEQEREALSRVKLAIYSSEWAARSAVELYGVPESRVRVVPFGANIVENRTQNDVARMIESRPRDRCRLLFVGVGWERKGGDVACEVARLLNERDVPTELILLGSNPPTDLKPPAYVKPQGFIDKRTEMGREKFDQLLASSHFLILPARAEAFGVVLCEAASFGLPALATRVGGIPTIVRDGTSGLLFDPEDPQCIADAVFDYMRNREDYLSLCRGAFGQYQQRLNWNVAAKTVKALLTQMI